MTRKALVLQRVEDARSRKVSAGVMVLAGLLWRT